VVATAGAVSTSCPLVGMIAKIVKGQFGEFLSLGLLEEDAVPVTSGRRALAAAIAARSIPDETGRVLLLAACERQRGQRPAGFPALKQIYLG
jgi:hypothetical protein